MAADMKKYEGFKNRLLAEKKEAEAAIAELLNEDMRESLAELSLIDNHPADIGTEVYERSRDIAQHDRIRHRIKAIDMALKRWSEGVYGSCEHCQKEILMERLDLIPYTTVCQECSRVEEIEEQHSFNREPVENKLVNSIVARSFKPENDRAVFDGEDSWQAVARYGTSETLQDLGTNRNIDDANSLYENSDEWIGAVEEIETLPTVSNPGEQNGIHYGTKH